MKTRLAAVFALALLLAASWAVAGTIELPKDLQELLPADLGALVCFTSVEELDAQLADLVKALEEEDSEEVPDLTGWLTEQLPRFDEIVDTGRPLAVAIDFTPVMMGQEPYLTFVVPMKASFTERDSLGLDAPTSSFAIQGDYVAVHTGPGFVPGGGIPGLAQNLAPGVMTANLDLEGLMLTYGPFIEMGLAAIPVGVAESDTMADGTVVSNPGMTQEEADALAEMIRTLTTSVKRLDLGFGAEGGRMAMTSRLDMMPDSPLAPGPQPDFEKALELTRLLPDGGNFLMAIAMDMGPQFEVFEDFYILNMRRESEKLGPEQGEKYAAWFEQYLGSKDLWANPMAASYRFGDEGMIAHMALESKDAAGDLDQLVGLIEGLSEVGMGVTLHPVEVPEVDGIEVRSWTVEIATDEMMGFTGSPTSPELSGMGRMQAEQMTAIMQKIVPGLSLCSRGDYILIAADDDPARLTGMIQAAGQRRGAANPDAARVAKAAGPGVAEIVSGDLMAVLTWVTEFMEEIDDEEWDTIKGNPIPFDGAYTIEGNRFGFTMNMDVSAMQDLIRALDEMDLDEGFDDDDDEDDEDEMKDEDEDPEEG